MIRESMGWWYWFGMQIFGVSSLLLVWWLFLDATRRKGSVSRYTWPFVGAAGLLMQIPAFTVAESAQSAPNGTTAALAGIAGLVLVAIAAITHFSTGGPSGSTWSLRTRDENSVSRSTSDRRRSKPPSASVPVSSQTPAASSTRSRQYPAAATRGGSSSSAASPPAPAAAPPAHKPNLTPTPSYDSTIHAEDSALHSSAATVVDDAAESALPATMIDEPDPTITNEPQYPPSAATITHDAESAPKDSDPAATILEEPATIVEELDEEQERLAPQLTITDGKSSRIIITDRSGPFIVGRDPSRCNLAVDDARSSRAHFSITEREGVFFASDLGSSNGTFVNGALVQTEHALQDGDTIEFGRTVATFKMPA